MRRVALVDYGKLELQDNYPEITELQEGTVKIDVKACSICGSDIALFKGKRSLETERYFGHEFVGTVLDAGAGANGIKTGMRVASELSIADDGCWNCRNGLPNFCRSMNDALLPGGFAENTLVLNTPQYSFISPIPEELDEITATLLEPTNCAFHAALQANLKFGEAVVVFGLGPMGLLAGMILKRLGAKIVVGVDNNPARIEKVRKLGLLDLVVDNKEADWQDQVREATGNGGPDVVIELTGVGVVFEQALEIARRGGRIVVASVYAGSTDGIGLWQIMRKELHIVGSKGPYPIRNTDGSSATVDLMVQMQGDIRKLITEYDYKDAIEAFDDMMSGKAIKAVIRFK